MQIHDAEEAEHKSRKSSQEKGGSEARHRPSARRARGGGSSRGAGVHTGNPTQTRRARAKRKKKASLAVSSCIEPHL